MNCMTEWLETYFDELEPKEFYREIFPVGSFQKKGEFSKGVYNGILVSVSQKDKSKRIRRYTVTDDLDVIDKVGKTDDFCLMSPISYAGKTRTAENARFLYAFAVDLDRLKVKGDTPVGLLALWENHIQTVGRIPKPTMIVSSGTGLHLYYVLKDPVAMYKNVVRELQELKRALTSLIWHDTIVDIESVHDIQQEGIYQGFRVPGTITKVGDRARAFLTGEKIDIEELQEYTKGFRKNRKKDEKSVFSKKKDLTLEQAKALYPDWYRRRIENDEPKGAWHVSRRLYDWWKRKILEGAVVGHRYYCMMMLAIYARKCSMYDPKHNPDPVTREELERDAWALFDHMESLTNSEDNHFTEADVLDALEAFDDKWITYPRNSIEYKSGIRIEPNKRNGRKQKDHLKVARAIQVVNDEINEVSWREGNGRKPKGDIVTDWKLAHPEGRKADCIRETGLDKKTVYKYW